MNKLLITATLLPTLALANPCKDFESVLDGVQNLYKQGKTLEQVLEVTSRQEKQIITKSWQWLERGDVRYTAWRFGRLDGCEYLNQGVFYYGKG